MKSRDLGQKQRRETAISCHLNSTVRKGELSTREIVKEITPENSISAVNGNPGYWKFL